MNLKIKKNKIDDKGYLINFKDWNKKLALKLANSESIEMNENHWEIVYCIREFYNKYNISPNVHMLVKFLFKKYGYKKGNSRYIFNLFPKGPIKQALKIAGLPKPSKCL